MPARRILALKFESSGYLQAPGGISGDRLSKKRRLQIADEGDVVDVIEEVEGIERQSKNIPFLFLTAEKEVGRKTGIQVHVGGTFQAVTRHTSRPRIGEPRAIEI